MENEEVAVDEQEMHPNDPDVRALRDEAEAYADRVRAGEEPWKEVATDASLPEPMNEDVGETGDADAEPVPVPDDIADAPPLDADSPTPKGEGD